MSGTILVVALVVFAFFGAHLLHRFTSRVLPGTEYLIIGALIGPHVPPHVLSTEALASLAPLVSLLLGLNGFLIGLQATRNFRELRPTLVGLGVALSTLIGCALVLAAAYGWLVPLEEPALVRHWLFELSGYHVELLLTRPQTAVAIVMAAVATVTFSATLSSLDRERLDAVPAFRVLRSCAFCGQVVAISVVAAVLAWSRSSATATIHLPAAGWYAGVLLFGIGLGICFTLFIGREHSTGRVFVVTIGTVTFGAGVGAELGVSSMFINLVTGAAVGLTLRERVDLQRELSRLQYPSSVLLLMLTGALWVPPERALLWLFPLVYLLTRWAARRALVPLWTRVLTNIDPTRIGAGLLSQGTLAVAVAVDYALQLPERAGLVLTTAIVGTLLFDVFAQRALERYLIDAEAEGGVLSQRAWAPNGVSS